MLIVVLIWWNENPLYGAQPETVLAALSLGMHAVPWSSLNRLPVKPRRGPTNQTDAAVKGAISRLLRLVGQAGSGALLLGVFSPSDPVRPDATKLDCGSQAGAISAMTRLVFVTQVLDPEDAVLGFVPNYLRPLACRVDRLVVIANEVREIHATSTPRSSPWERKKV